MAKKPQFPNWQRALLRWTPFGGTAGLMLHGIWSADPTQAAASALGTLAAAFWGAYSEGVIEQAEEELNQLGRQHAQGVFQVGRVVSRRTQKRLITLKWQIADDFQRQYYQRLDVICYGFETKGIALDKALSLQKVFVPVRLTVGNLAEICTTRLLEKAKPRAAEADLQEAQELGHYLKRMCKDRRFRRLAILGTPGSGKTTLMRYLTLMYALRQPNTLHPDAPQLLPVLLYLRNIYEEILTRPEVTLAELMTQYVQNLPLTEPLNVPRGWFAEQLRLNRCLVLLDGFDEIADAQHRQAVARWVDQQMGALPETPFILTSRPKGYDEAQLQQSVLVLKVQPFNRAQMGAFVTNWYREVEAMRYVEREDVAKEEAHRQTKALLQQIDGDKTLTKLAENPLLLTLMATVHQQSQSLPRQRVELYRMICEVLLEKRQEAKGIPSQLSATDKRSVLEPLALELMKRGTRTFRFEDMEPLVQKHLSLLPNTPTPQVFLKQLQDVDALIAKEREGDLEFAHLSFQEYLAAARVKELRDESVLLAEIDRLTNLSWWAETMRLYAAQADASKLVEAIVRTPEAETVRLAWDFCQEGRVADSTKQKLLALSNEPLKVLDIEDYNYAVSVQPRYLPLARYLQTGRWREADRETLEIMDCFMGDWSVDNIKAFPCEDLYVLDRLWLKYSQGKFGFSVQKQIWLEVGGKLDYAQDWVAANIAFERLSDCATWRQEGNFLTYSDLDFSSSAVRARLPWEVCMAVGRRWYGALLSHPGL